MSLMACCADISRAGELISDATSASPQAASVAFAAVLGLLCYGLKPKVMDQLNSLLVVGVVAAFVVRPSPLPKRIIHSLQRVLLLNALHVQNCLMLLAQFPATTHRDVHQFCSMVGRPLDCNVCRLFSPVLPLRSM